MENEKTTKKYFEPELQIIHLTETDIITTSGGDFKDEEGELMPVLGFDNLN